MIHIRGKCKNSQNYNHSKMLINCKTETFIVFNNTLMKYLKNCHFILGFVITIRF